MRHRLSFLALALTLLISSWQMAKLLTRMPLPENAAWQLYATDLKDDLESLFLQAIEQSTSSLHLWIYALTDAKIIQALAAKAKSIPVEIHADQNASQALKASPFSLSYKKTRGLMHRKILIADGRFVLIGSANMTLFSLKYYSNLVIAIDSQALADWLCDEEKKCFSFTEPPIECHLLPESQNALKRVTASIDAAKHSLKAAFFTWTHPELTQALLRAAQRGVAVEVLVDRTSRKGASKKAIDRLAAAGVSLRINIKEGLMHHKFLYIDQELFITGSTNGTKAAFTQNDDCLMILNMLSAKQQRRIDQLWRILYNESKKDFGMRLVLVGYGKMGKMCEEAAQEMGHEIAARLSSSSQEIGAEGDAFIDFSHPGCVLTHVKALAPLKKPIVIGTTGWYEHLEEIAKIAEEHQAPILWGENFSLGVNLFLKAAGQMAALFKGNEDYDIAAQECHHRQKKDVPSGTALALSRILLKELPLKKTVSFTNAPEHVDKETLYFPSLRLGTTVGMHQVLFDSIDDTITLTHQAKGRLAYARGAILAAAWLKKQGKSGLFHFQDMLFD
jgi:4-hydroxy-tetrahydrodipicolinate reductase